MHTKCREGNHTRVCQSQQYISFACILSSRQNLPSTPHHQHIQHHLLAAQKLLESLCKSPSKIAKWVPCGLPWKPPLRLKTQTQNKKDSCPEQETPRLETTHVFPRCEFRWLTRSCCSSVMVWRIRCQELKVQVAQPSQQESLWQEARQKEALLSLFQVF